MLNFFRTNQQAFNIFLIIYAILLRGSMFIIPDQGWSPGKSGVFSMWVYELCDPFGRLPFIIGIVLVFVQGVLINFLVAQFRMANEVTLLPGLCYILLASSIPDFLYLSPILMANTFFIIALFELFGSYRQSSVIGNMFNVGFWLGVGSLFYFSELTFLLLAIFSSTILRTFSARETLVTIIGCTTPYILTGVYFFWYDQFLWFLQNQFVNNLGFFDFDISHSLSTYGKLGFFGLLFIIVFTGFGNYMFKKNLQVQKNISILYWALFFGFLTLMIQSGVKLEHLLVFAVPLSIFLSFNLLNLRQSFAEAIHFVLLMGILILQFKYYWI